MSNGITVLFDEHPRRLIRDAKLNEDFPVIVVDVLEANPVPFNKIRHGFEAPIPSNTDDGDFLRKLQMCALDRGRFKIACDSTGCPKPQGNWVLGKLLAEDERGAVKSRRCELDGQFRRIRGDGCAVANRITATGERNGAGDNDDAHQMSHVQ